MKSEFRTGLLEEQPDAIVAQDSLLHGEALAKRTFYGLGAEGSGFRDQGEGVTDSKGLGV